MERRIWSELRQVDPQRPVMRSRDAAPFELSSERRSNSKGPRCGSVEPAHDRPEQRRRKPSPHRDIIRETGVEGRGVRYPPLEAPRARCPPKRPFRCDMDRDRCESIHPARDFAPAADREANFGVSWTADGPVLFGTDRLDVEASAEKVIHRRTKRPYHPIDLRVPRIRRDEDPHAGSNSPGSARAGHSAGTLRSSVRRRSAQSRISMRPSKCSTSAVQLSTQSPSL